MFGIDQRVASLGEGDALLVVAAVAILLGLRHATDPDHLTAVSSLIAGDQERGARRAGQLGLSWGLGHATTLFALGLPIVLFGAYLPQRLQQLAEIAVGLLIMLLAGRLLVHWRSGGFHAHAHRHGELVHRHLHAHRGAVEHRSRAPEHRHEHESRLGRSPLQAYGIGLFHGVGGSAGVGVLLLASIPDHAVGVLALSLFALFTALSMAVASTAFGYALSRGPVVRRLAAVAPALGVGSLAFGAWYALAAAGALPYAF